MAPHLATSRPTRQLRFTALALVLLALTAFGLAACGDNGDDVGAGDTGTTAASSAADDGYGGSGDSATTEGTTIVAKDFSLTSITVAPGADVKVDNQGSASHTVTADDGAFDSGTVSGGSSGSFTAPSEPGEYSFHCEIHSSMTGTLTVEG